MSKRMTVVFDDEGLYTALKVEAARNGQHAKDIVCRRRFVTGCRPERTRSCKPVWPSHARSGNRTAGGKPVSSSPKLDAAPPG